MTYARGRSLLAWLIYLLAALAVHPSSHAAVQTPDNAAIVISEAETTERFSRGATLTEPGNAKQGRRAVAWTAPEREMVGTLHYALDDQCERIARAKTLTFWYRFDGAKPQSRSCSRSSRRRWRAAGRRSIR